MDSESEWRRWANCRPNSLKINMVSRVTAKTSTVCQPIPVSYVHNNRLPFFFRPGSVTQHTGSNGCNVLKHDGQISSLTFQMYLISFTGLFNWMRKTLEGQEDWHGSSRIEFCSWLKLCAVRIIAPTVWEPKKKKPVSAQSVNTLWCLLLKRWQHHECVFLLDVGLFSYFCNYCPVEFHSFSLSFVSHVVKRIGRHQSRHGIIDLEQDCRNNRWC